ncbi:MAG: redoxin domain-containing protein, partial [Planctomycetales bacterium]
MDAITTKPLANVRIGAPVPEFQLAMVSGDNAEPRMVKSADYRGRWLVLIFYPRDFSFVCPTELTSFSARIEDFRQRDCDLLAVSVDTTELHNEWLNTPESDGGLGPLQYPLGSDPEGTVAKAFGVWIDDKEVSTRGLFIIDPDGIVQYTVIHNLSVGRSAEEILRVLDALRSGGLCPASWTRADGTLDAENALQPGRILGHYRIQKKLGEGSFGSVFGVHDMRLQRMVALKVLRKSLGESHDMLLQEARMAAALNHSNVCTIYTVDIIDGLPLIAMEYIEGRTLADVIHDGLGLES